MRLMKYTEGWTRRHFLEHFSEPELELLSGYWERVTPSCC